jgi:DeoR family fructose operon transcriptional repressor
MTIRRDLAELERSGQALRCYGGASPAQRITFEFAFDERRRRNLPQKRRIAAEAARRVQPGQTVFMDTGVTTLELARALTSCAVPCTVVTSSLVIASELWGSESVDLMLLGGRVRRGSPDLAGPPTEIMLERLTADIAFVGSDGLDPDRGVFAVDLESARVAERMVASARRVIVVTDSSKLGTASNVRYAVLEDVDELITDDRAPAKMLAAIRRRNVDVAIA